jgi:hypothetical protein
MSMEAGAYGTTEWFGQPLRPKRLFVALLLLAFALVPGGFGALTRELMVDAYLQVSAFVAATLLLFYGSERLFRFNIGEALSKARRAQVPMAALMGATPGCGGAVVVVAAYSSGHVSFGAVVATLTATMGDAAFLLIATRPDVAAVVLPLSFTMGIISGWIIDAARLAPLTGGAADTRDIVPRIGRLRARDLAFLAVAVPGLIMGVTDVTGAEIGAIFGDVPVAVVGLTGTAIGIAIWAISPLTAMTNSSDAPATRVAEETAFISVWVIGAYLAYDYMAAYGGLDLEAMFATVAPLLPLIGVVIGFVPGCGPQVLVTTLYINGLIPFSALMGNAISNDGDALFPAIAINPRAAVLATLYSAVPALMVAYGFYLFAPGFLN